MTLNIDDHIMKKAAELTGVKEKASLVRMGLEALIARESARRLADLGGSEKDLRLIPRRKPGRRAVPAGSHGPPYVSFIKSQDERRQSLRRKHSQAEPGNEN